MPLYIIIVINMKRLFIVISIALMSSCVKTKDYYIEVINESDSIIEVGYNMVYPTDSLTVIDWPSWNRPYIIKPHSSERLICTWTGKTSTWYLAFGKADMDYGGYVSIYIGHVDQEFYETSFDERGFPLIDFEIPIIARYDLRQEEIEALNWEISYPPSPEMKDIHMWPRYDQYREEEQ